MSMQKQLLIVLAICLGLALLWWSKQDPQLDHLNNVLAADAELQAYPYHFRVLRVENGTAVISSPRSSQQSVLDFLKRIRPNLDLRNPDSEAVIAAQKELAHVQEKAAEHIRAQPGIRDTGWELDRNWFMQHGINLQQP